MHGLGREESAWDGDDRSRPKGEPQAASQPLHFIPVHAPRPPRRPPALLGRRFLLRVQRQYSSLCSPPGFSFEQSADGPVSFLLVGAQFTRRGQDLPQELQLLAAIAAVIAQ